MHFLRQNPNLTLPGSYHLSNTQGMCMQLVARFSSWGSGDCSGVCWLAFGGRSRLLLLSCLRPPLFFPNPPFFSHVPRRCMQLGLLVLLWEERLLQPRLLAGCFFGRGKRQEHTAPFGKSAPFSLLATFIPFLNAKRVFGGLDKVVPIPLLG